MSGPSRPRGAPRKVRKLGPWEGGQLGGAGGRYHGMCFPAPIHSRTSPLPALHVRWSVSGSCSFGCVGAQSSETYMWTSGWMRAIPSSACMQCCWESGPNKNGSFARTEPPEIVAGRRQEKLSNQEGGGDDDDRVGAPNLLLLRVYRTGQSNTSSNTNIRYYCYYCLPWSGEYQ